MRIVLVSFLLVVISSIASAQPVQINLSTRVEARTFAGTEFHTETDTVIAQSAVVGKELSQCEPYGRKSRATSIIKVVSQVRQGVGARLDLSFASYANGGDYRTCGKCDNDGICSNISGYETEARARGYASARLEVEFGDSAESRYEIIVTPSSMPDDTIIKLISTDGKVVDLASKESSTIPISAIPGQRAEISLVLDRQVADRGGCCSSEEITDASVNIDVKPAAILDSASRSEIPFIMNGDVTAGYPEVGAIGLRNKIHCTGTMIGSRTVLTAAHCVAHHISAISDGEMDFRLGSVFNSPQRIVRIVDQRVHDDFNKDQCTKEIPICHNDIAVVYLETPINQPVVDLYAGNPTWSQYKQEEGSATFVGYGYGSQSSGIPVYPGQKREAVWPVDEILTSRVRWHNSTFGTCEGDSGGPGFMRVRTPESGSRYVLLLAMITSLGDKNACAFGTNTRVDYYLPWIKQHLKA